MFLPSKETPEPGQAVLLMEGKKQALERAACVLLRQSKGWDWKNQAEREGFGTVGSPACRAFGKETSQLL